MILFILFVFAVGGAFAFFIRPSKWVWIVTVWLCVPLGQFLWAVVGSYVADIGGCEWSARGPIDCIVYGYDVSEWINDLPYGGYAIAFLGIPWFLVGAVPILGYAAHRLVQSVHRLVLSRRR